MTSPLLGEFLGTMILILLGNGVVAGVLLKRSKAEGSGWIVITAGWAFAVMAGVFTAIAGGSSDAHLNPAVTLGFAARAGDFSKV
ncbi:MAG TPA: aquaporin, partial [Gemmatimonadales bacterium]|nr:aquaporin [Gemmatimonadales bacterium]